MKYFRVFGLTTLLVMSMTMGSAAAANAPDTAESTAVNPNAFEGYVHATGSLGLGLLTSDDVSGLFTGATGLDFGIGIGIPLTYGVCAGYRNILQAQIRKGSCSHNLNHNDITELTTNITIKMDYDFNEKLLKFNPFFAVMSPGKALFFVFGKGDVDYRDGSGDGYSGTSTILGMEWTRISKNATYGFGLLHSQVKFDEFKLMGVPLTSDAQGGDWVFQFQGSVGFGI